MGNKIYTIGREFGSGGREIGEKLAERLRIVTAGGKGKRFLRGDFRES